MQNQRIVWKGEKERSLLGPRDESGVVGAVAEARFEERGVGEVKNGGVKERKKKNLRGWVVVKNK